ncbi:uncharacterized protein, partial [Fopius arisanus]|uniref:Uncharacterized protein n=1 Tax=Fopius arisanus TaxID=64838 RepID=A0A9R1SZ70_9HYME
RLQSISPGLVKREMVENTPLGNLVDETAALVPEDVAGVVLYALGTRPEVQMTKLTIRRTGELMASYVISVSGNSPHCLYHHKYI